MNLPIFIARRYFIARKSQHVINIISWVSMAGIATGTAGLIIVLSVFNGFSDLITGLYDAFDPDIKITAKKGKVFDPGAARMTELLKIEGVAHACYVLEENALVRYRDRQAIATIKGVDSNFSRTSRIEQYMADGEFVLQEGEARYAIPGSGLAYTLGMNLDDVFSTLNLYVPKKGKGTALIPEQAFTSRVARPAGVFAIQQDFDSKYILVPLSLARDLVGEPTQISAVELSIDNGAEAANVKHLLEQHLGTGFHVSDRLEQHDFLNRIFQSEKWAIYIILGFILLIAAFSIIGSVTMLVIEKKRDLSTLIAMGAPLSSVRRIFIVQGTLISLVGGIAGLALGGGIVLAQRQFSFVKISNSDAFLIDAYPVVIQPIDFLLSFLMVLSIGFLLSWFTSINVIRPGRVVSGKG